MYFLTGVKHMQIIGPVSPPSLPLKHGSKPFHKPKTSRIATNFDTPAVFLPRISACSCYIDVLISRVAVSCYSIGHASLIMLMFERTSWSFWSPIRLFSIFHSSFVFNCDKYFWPGVHWMCPKVSKCTRNLTLIAIF